MKLIIDAVDEMIAGLRKNGTYISDSNFRTTNIRLDVEQIGSQDRFALVKEKAVEELTDLIINGDTEQNEDMLLKALDGEKKRDEKCTHFEVSSAILDPGKKNGNVITHTLWMVIYVQFDDVDTDPINAVASRDNYISPDTLPA